MKQPLFVIEGNSVHLEDTGVYIQHAGDLLELYVATDDEAPLMTTLNAVRDHYLSDLDAVDQPTQVVGLIAWLLREHNINHQGESLAETADRLSDLDTTTNSANLDYSTLIYHIRDALERLDDLELFED